MNCFEIFIFIIIYQKFIIINNIWIYHFWFIIRKTNFDTEIKTFINSGKIYIGSSAGSEILGNSIETALPYDENIVNMSDFTGLKIVDGLIVPHCNRKKEFIKKISSEKDNIIQLFDGSGLIV